MNDTIFCRNQGVIDRTYVRPKPLKNYDVRQTEDGKIEYFEKDPVRKGLAKEFSVDSNVMVNRPQRSQYRANVDPVDLEKFVEQSK